MSKYTLGPSFSSLYFFCITPGESNIAPATHTHRPKLTTQQYQYHPFILSPIHSTMPHSSFSEEEATVIHRPLTPSLNTSYTSFRTAKSAKSDPDNYYSLESNDRSAGSGSLVPSDDHGSVTPLQSSGRSARNLIFDKLYVPILPIWCSVKSAYQ
jgi:hypothetical protein